MDKTQKTESAQNEATPLEMAASKDIQDGNPVVSMTGGYGQKPAQGEASEAELQNEPQ